MDQGMCIDNFKRLKLYNVSSCHNFLLLSLFHNSCSWKMSIFKDNWQEVLQILIILTQQFVISELLHGFSWCWHKGCGINFTAFTNGSRSLTFKGISGVFWDPGGIHRSFFLNRFACRCQFFCYIFSHLIAHKLPLNVYDWNHPSRFSFI